MPGQCWTNPEHVNLATFLAVRVFACDNPHWSSKQNSGELHCIVAISALLVMWYAVYYYSGHRKANAPQSLLCMQELSTENYEYHTLTTMPQWLQFCLQQNFSVTHWMDEMMAWANRVWTQFRKWSKYHPKKSNRVVVIHQIFLSVIEKATKQNDSFHLFFWSINKKDVRRKYKYATLLVSSALINRQN